MSQHALEVQADTWAKEVRLNSSFQRSVNVLRDLEDHRWLNGYILTPLVRATIRRIADGLAMDATARAWSLTGPYGAGKSAFALFLAQLLGLAGEAPSRSARRILKQSDEDLHSLLFGRGGTVGRYGGLCPVVVVGDRRPLHDLFLAALRNGVEAFWAGPGAKPEVYKMVIEASDQAKAGKEIPNQEIVELFEDVAQSIGQSNRTGAGLLVILDEAGKALEYAAHNPEKSDVNLLQELAEAASRSQDHPLVFITLLHQSFEHYALHIGQQKRADWAKVQGRFEDVIFQESSDDQLRLIGAAIQCQGIPEQHQALIRRILHSAVSVSKIPGLNSKERLARLLSDTVPLHPLTALSLGALFRGGFSQNERSLFAFLATNEPGGFQSFLRSRSVFQRQSPLYGLDDLYDYLVNTFGGRLFAQTGRAWSQIETALRRLPEYCDELDARLVKAIGVINALGDASGLTASKETLCTAVGLVSSKATKEVEEALERLVHASIVVYRRYRNSYQIWEGSDLDLSALTYEAMRRIDPGQGLVDRISKVAVPRPLVARRHFFETGTLRYFSLHYADEAALESAVFEDPDQADGAVWLIFPSSEMEAQEARRRLDDPATWSSRPANSRPVLVGVPESPGSIRDLATELTALQHVLTHTPQLSSDPVARRELQARLGEAERLVRQEVGRLLTGGRACNWYRDGQRFVFGHSRELAKTLSDICDDIYDSAPRIHNELLNRRQISSSAAAARKNLMAAMLERAEQPRLGFEGFPPEVSLYLSVLEYHGIHANGKIGRPTIRAGKSVRGVFDQIGEILSAHDGEHVPIGSVYEVLRRPPYGLKDGVLPILLLAALIDLEAEVALFEDGAFVTKIDGPEIERLLRAPDKFTLQRFRLRGQRSELLLALMGGDWKRKASDCLLPVVRQLVRLARDLPEFTHFTRRISPEAQAVREALIRAKEPGKLLFQTIPQALGLPETTDMGRPEAEYSRRYVQALQSALRELKTVYQGLMDGVSVELTDSFGLPSSLAEARPELAARSRRILGQAFDSQLKGFLIRAVDEEMGEDEWLVSIATHLGSKPPETWRDHDFHQMQTILKLVRSRFEALEAIELERAGSGKQDGKRYMRLTVFEPGEVDLQRVISVSAKDQKRVRSLSREILGALGKRNPSLSSHLALAALAAAAQELSSGEASGNQEEED